MTEKEMKVNIEDISTVKKRLTVEIPADEVAREIDSAYRDLGTEVVVAGFRKGRVPVSILKARFRERVLGDVRTRLIEKTYPRIIEERGIKPVSRPVIDAGEVREGGGFSYSATFEVKPEVDVQGYKGMELERKEVEVTDKDVDDAIERLRETRGEFSEVERPARDGDLLTVDYEGFVDGAPLKGGSGRDYSFILGSGSLFKEIEDSLRGSSKGEKKEVKTTFPKDHRNRTLAGKEVTFRIGVKSIKERVLPEVDDEFAKDMGFDNLSSLRERLKDEVKKGKEEREKERLKEEILNTLIERNSFEVPESLLTAYLAHILNRILGNIKRGIVNPEDRGLSSEELKKKYHELALRQVKGDIIIEEIARKENIKVKDEEVDAFIKGMASRRKESPEVLKARLEKEGTIDIIRDEIRTEKVFDLVIKESKPPSEKGLIETP